MTVIWQNPRCSKSRQALALLEERGGGITVRRYLDDPPTLEELRAAKARPGLSAIAMMRPGEATFKARGLSRSDPDEVLFGAMAETPALIERPMVFSSGRAAIGRPPDRVLEINEGRAPRDHRLRRAPGVLE